MVADSHQRRSFEIFSRSSAAVPKRETSVRQLIGRVADTVSGWGEKQGYFPTMPLARLSAPN